MGARPSIQLALTLSPPALPSSLSLLHPPSSLAFTLPPECPLLISSFLSPPHHYQLPTINIASGNSHHFHLFWLNHLNSSLALPSPSRSQLLKNLQVRLHPCPHSFPYLIRIAPLRSLANSQPHFPQISLHRHPPPGPLRPHLPRNGSSSPIMHTILRSARVWMTTRKSIFVIRHSPQSALSQRKASYVMTPRPPSLHLVFLRFPLLLFILYQYNGPVRTSNEGTQYLMSSTTVITTMDACSNIPGTLATGLLSLHSTRNTAHFQIRLHQILHITSMVPSLPVLSFSTLSSVSRILYGPPTIPKMHA